MLAAMRDEQYAAEDLPAYGAHQQPALLSRTQRHRWTTRIGVLVAGVGLGCAVAGLLTYPDIDGFHRGRNWVVGLVCCSAAMTVLCLVQHLSWRRAAQVWHGRRDDDLGAVVAVSWVLHLVSYPLVLAISVVSVIALFQVGRYATTAVLVVLALLAALAAQVLAAVQYVRAEGPPGTVPARMRVRRP